MAERQQLARGGTISLCGVRPDASQRQVVGHADRPRSVFGKYEVGAVGVLGYEVLGFRGGGDHFHGIDAVERVPRLKFSDLGIG